MGGIKKAFKKIFSKPKKQAPVAPPVDLEALRKGAVDKDRRGRASALLGGNRGSRLTGAGGVEDARGTATKKLLGQ